MQLSVLWEHASLERLQLNTALFLVSFVYTLAAAISSGIPGRAKIAFTACAVHFLAGFSYFLMSRNLVPLITSPNTGRPLVLARIFEWSVTVPCLLSLIGRLVDPDQKRIKQLRTRFMLCLLVGGLGPLLPFPMNWLFFVASCYLQLLVCITMHGYFAGMKRKLRNRHDRMCIFLLHGAVLTIFVVYPIVWLIAVELGLMPLATEMTWFANLDVSAKLVLTSVLSNMTAAAYDYALVDFPQYFQVFTDSVTVPAFAVSDGHIITHWNTSMEAATGVPAGEVLYESVSKCNVFTPQGVEVVEAGLEPGPGAAQKALERIDGAVVMPDGGNLPCPVVNVGFKLRGNPQDSYMAPFFVLFNNANTGKLPRAVFVEATGNAAVTSKAVQEMARHFYGATTGKAV